MVNLPIFALDKYLAENEHKATHVLAGSAAPSISIEELISLSTDGPATEEALNLRALKLPRGPNQGTLAVRRAIAAQYNGDARRGGSISPDHVVTANGTTGANGLALQSLLSAADHAICLYPTFPPLISLAEAFAGEVSYWAPQPEAGWRPDLDELRGLIRPSTKLIVLNNPNNPTGWHFDGDLQRQILDIAQEKGLIVLADEIFRPLYVLPPDTVGLPPPSFVEHDYAKVLVTGSLSKVWGMSGVRIGWVVCRDQSILDVLLNTRQYTVQATSTIDEVIATEVLSDRCRPALLRRHLAYEQQGLALLDAFVERNKDLVSWTRSTAGATAFVKFSRPTGEPLDDLAFSQALLEKKGVLVSPGSLCFSGTSRTDFQGYVRLHVTKQPELIAQALDLISNFLDEEYRAA